MYVGLYVTITKIHRNNEYSQILDCYDHDNNIAFKFILKIYDSYLLFESLNDNTEHLASLIASSEFNKLKPCEDFCIIYKSNNYDIFKHHFSYFRKKNIQ